MRDYPHIYSQRDPAWAGQRLGTVDGITIGGYGCILTCQAMKAGYYGHEVKPNALDDIFTNRNIYVQGDMLPDVGIHQIFDDIKLIDTRAYSGPADMAYIKSVSDDPSKTMTIEVDFDHDPNDGIQTHFVELHSFDGIHLRIYDPWYGQEDDFATHYGTNPQQTIQKVAVYQGNVGKPQILVDSDTYEKLVGNSTANDAVCDELGLPHNAGKDAEVSAIRKLKEDKAKAEQTVGTLNQQLPALKTENETQAGQIKTLTQQLEDAQKAAQHPGTDQSFKDLYEQSEKSLKETKDLLAASETKNKQQMSQYTNTSALLMPKQQLLQILLGRLFTK